MEADQLQQTALKTAAVDLLLQVCGEIREALSIGGDREAGQQLLHRCQKALQESCPVRVVAAEVPPAAAMTSELTLLYDGGCPLCLREVTFLKRRDQRQRLAFVDINATDYRSAEHQGITYREAMGRIHAVQADGTVLRDVAVFREAYRLIGLGWIYAPTRWPLLGPLADAAYGLWARWRLPLTGRPNLDELCACRLEAAADQPR